MGYNLKEAFADMPITVGVPNELQMTRNLTGGLPVLYQGHLARLGPFRERLTPAHEKRYKGNTGGHRSTGMQNGQQENARMHAMNMYANAVLMIT